MLGVYFAAKLFIAIHVPCFLVDEDGPVGAFVMIRLKQKVSSATILEYTSAHLNSDKLPFNLLDVNASFLEVNIICLIWRTQEEV